MKAIAKYFCLILFATLLLVGIVEATARVFITVEKDWTQVSRHNWMEVSPTLGWRPRPAYKGWAAREYREFDSQGKVVRVGERKDGITHKILLIGDSCTYGLKVPAEATFGALLEKKLQGTEVVNLAVPGYSSYQGVEILKNNLRLRPDLIVASFSFNDRRYVLDENRHDGVEKFSRHAQWSWVFRLANSSYFIQWFQENPKKSVDLRKITVRVPYLQYRENLKTMTELAAAKNIPIVFIVMQDNPNFMVHTKRGMQLNKEGSVQKAIDIFKEAITVNPFVADLPKLFMARAYEALGDEGNANKVAMIRPKFRYDGGGPLRIDSQYAEAMIEIGQQHGVEVLDARPLLGERPSVFFDVVHFDERGHKMIADGLHDFIKQNHLLAKRNHLSAMEFP